MIKITTASGSLEVSPRWRGRHLAVTPPIKDGQPIQPRGQWVITHTATGFSCGTVLCNQRQAIQLARQWDDRFGLITSPAGARTWPHSEDWGRAIQAINSIHAHSWQTTDTDDTAAELAATAGRPLDQAGSVRRIHWRGKWWRLPTDTELEVWTFDSVCETPDGRIVEPDHPDSWLRILGLV
jgi:hypothetical protein